MVALTRYPVKSLVGEDVDRVDVDLRGVVGDRLWAVRDPDGKLGSGKTTRRFRRMDGLLGLRARYDDDLQPLVELPDGRGLGPGAELDAALSDHVGRPVALGREAGVSHFDEGPLHLVTLAALARLGELSGGAVDRRRARANVVVDTGGAPMLDETAWVGRRLGLGPDLVAEVRVPMTRCLMLDLPQRGLGPDGRLLRSVAEHNDTRLGLVLDVLTPGTLAVGDRVAGSP